MMELNVKPKKKICYICGGISSYGICNDCWDKHEKCGYLNQFVPEDMKGGQNRMNKEKGEMKQVSVPLTLDSVATVNCPYCGWDRLVEPDAAYVVECEGCEKKYRVVNSFF